MITWRDKGDFAIVSTSGRRSAMASAPLPIPEWMIAPSTEVVGTVELASRPARRTDGPSVLRFGVADAGDVRHVTIIRHASGALTIHPGDRDARERRGSPTTETSFAITIPGPTGDERRGAVSRIVKVVVLKVLGKLTDLSLPRLAAAWEAAAWSKKGRSEGWRSVTADSLRLGSLGSANAPPAGKPGDRALVFVHGTFSHAAAAFSSLAATGFFANVAGLYQDRIYAYDHFTVSKTSAENAKEMLTALGSNSLQVDVITHSRGGLVLREASELWNGLGFAAAPLDVRRAVLVASPNAGTPLATRKRWQDTVGLFANILEMFPENPLTTGAEFVAEGIVWIAHRAAGGLPGIGSMDADSPIIDDLQNNPRPRPAGYHALVANYAPTASEARRLLDAGVDTFFGGANDLVVPTEGGWRLAWQTPDAISAQRIGCFGAGGNLTARQDVNHVRFFGEPNTTRFLTEALTDASHGLAAIDLTKALPFGALFRSIAPSSAAPKAEAPETPATAPPAQPDIVRKGEPPAAPERAPPSTLSPAYSDTFQLIMTDPYAVYGRKGHKPVALSERGTIQLVASYGGARVSVDVQTRNTKPDAGNDGEAHASSYLKTPATGQSANGDRFYRIIEVHKQIRAFIDGKLDDKGKRVAIPTNDQLVELGKELFEVLFPPRVRRLYDTARARERGGHLNVVFTSQVPWIADKAWEFAFDPDRNTYLATEDLQFLRNVISDNPAEKILPRPGPLQILVVVAQPLDAGALSAEDEVRLIMSGFQPLVDSGRVRVDVLPHATPAKLHGFMTTAEWDVVHFIGHGEFDFESGQGYLLFEDASGATHRVDPRTAKEILCHRGVRLVFLNACETGRGGRADFNEGIAGALVEGGLPAVVANQFKVLDTSATAFAQHFYFELAQGKTVGAAAREARIAVNYAIAGESIDWAVPVVYSRDPEGRLCEERAGGRLAALTPAAMRESRDAPAPHPYKIALWNVSRRDLDLNALVAAMNAAQNQLGFELRNFEIPIGGWQAHNGVVCLLPEQIAEKVAGMNQTLGVDYVIGIADLPLAAPHDGELLLDFYNWWGEPEDQIGFVSTSFTEFGDDVESTNRYLVNCIVAQLAGKWLNADLSPKGARRLPAPSELRALVRTRFRTHEVRQGLPLRSCGDLAARKIVRARKSAARVRRPCG